MTGTVKSLDWVERVGVTGTFDAETSIGHFIATVNDDNQAFWFILGLTRSNYVGGPDVEAAKAAAQADYERRVLSALTASASEPAALLIEQVDALLALASRDALTPKVPHLALELLRRCRDAMVPPVPASEPEPVAWAPKGHIDRYLRSGKQHSGAWVYATPTGSDSEPLYAKPVPTPDGSMYGEYTPITVGASTTITPDGAVEADVETCNCPTFEHCDGSCAPYLGAKAKEVSVNEAMVKAAIAAAWPDGEGIYDDSFASIEDQMRAALFAALSHPSNDGAVEVKQALADIEACLDEAVGYLVDLAGAKPDKHSTQNCRAHIEQARFYAKRLAAAPASEKDQ